MRFALLSFLATLIAPAQLPAPYFHPERVLPSGSAKPSPLYPGMLVSIYGDRLGPEQPCTAQADTQRLEPLPPGLPPASQRYVNRLRFPTALCGVQVFLAGKPAGMLYAQARQINFKVPLDAPFEGVAGLRVVYNGTSSAPIELPLGLPQPAISVDEPAHAAGPVWLRVEMPLGWGPLRYPFSLQAGDFGCNEVEVRRNGVLLHRLETRSAGGFLPGGLRCGSIGLPGPEKPADRGGLPLHAAYRFSEAGEYEVRYSLRDGAFPPEKSALLFRSEWTRFRLMPPAAGELPLRPANASELLTRYIPNLLASPDARSLAALGPLLYDPESLVRRFAAAALVYWAEPMVEAELEELLASRGPSDAFITTLTARRPDLVPAAARFLNSTDPVLLSGALAAIAARLRPNSQTPDDSILPLETALLEAARTLSASLDPQTLGQFASTLALVRAPEARDRLWDLVARNIAREQSLIAITWRKDPRDLPRLSAALQSFASTDPLDSTLSSLPYALHTAYGEAAIPALESVLRDSKQVWVQTNSARELVVARRPSGFAFILNAIEREKPYRNELIAFLRDRFPELRTAPIPAVVAFLREHAR